MSYVESGVSGPVGGCSRIESMYRGSKEPRMNEAVTTQIMGDQCRPRGLGSASIGMMRGTEVLLAEVLMFKGMGVGNMDMTLGFEVVELVRGVMVTADKGSEMELGWGNWEDREE
jgi:hypothetical protein